MNMSPIFPIFGEGFSLGEDFAAIFRRFPRLSLRDHGGDRRIRCRRSTASLAAWTGEAGGPTAARDQYTALLPDLEQVLGAGHPDTLTARASLARWTMQAGQPHRTRRRPRATR